VRDLIRRDYERAVKISRLQALATEGIESGAGQRSMAELKAAAKTTAGG
jgi:antitoxin ParD1/3/4